MSNPKAMNRIKTWRERCNEHPDHNGIVSDGMIQQRMQEEIDELRQALEQAEQQEPLGWRWKERINGELDNWVVTSCKPPPYAVEKQPLYTAPPQRQPLTWQPIETAPKDATAVLIMRDIWPGTNTGRADECNGHNTYVAAWWADEGPSGNWVCYTDSVSEPTCPIQPTHWMPLPPPPIEADHGIKEKV